MTFNLSDVRVHWNIIKPLNSNGFLEVRLTPVVVDDYDEFWKHLDGLKRLMGVKFGTPCFKVSFFVKSWEEFEEIVLFRDSYFVYNSKMCYGLQLRFKDKDGFIDGSYSSVNEVRLIGFDVESKDKGKPVGFKKELFDKYVFGVVSVLEKYGLFNPSIISSGAGKHLLYFIETQRITDGRKEWYKSFIDELNVVCSNDYFVLDPLKDFTRIWGCVYNPKRKEPIIVESISDHVSKSFKIKSKRQPKIVTDVRDVLSVGSVKDSLEFNILLKGESVPKGERNSVLVFFLKMLIRDTGEDYRLFEKVLKNHFGDINLNPSQGIKGKSYNKGGVLNWCRENMGWLEQHDDLLELYNDYRSVSSDLEPLMVPDDLQGEFTKYV